MFSFLFFSIGRAWQGFWRNAAMSLAATATMTLMLLLLSGFWIIQAGFLASLSYVEAKVGVVADLEDGTTALEVRDLEDRLQAMPEVTSVEYITKDQALQRYRDERAKQGQPDLTTFLAENPLPASLEVKLKSPSDYGKIADFLDAEGVVSKVQNIEDTTTRLVSITSFLRTFGVLLLAVIGAIVLFIVINTIRLAVLGRAEEIEVMRLVGASDAFIRWPFVFEGALVGLLGAVVTLGVLIGAAEPLSQFMVGFFSILPINVGSISRDVTLLVVGSGMGLGIVGAWVSVRTYLIR
ncbi:MAG TPA: permease-like cell division protein FtsX [Candidatus Limnocylindrales bacterium]|jgi:cell division transport system permease protein|nr:permease-like cell division protein FtsX [Candidatus Limnocylindrales bacterium]